SGQFLGGNFSANNISAGLFGNGSGNFSFPSSVGVNTSTNASLPQALTVYGNAQVTGLEYVSAADAVGSPGYSWIGDTNTGMFRPATDIIGFATNGAERLRINVSGISTSYNVTTTNLAITGLAGASGCLSVNGSGYVVTSTCSGGSGVSGSGNSGIVPLW